MKFKKGDKIRRIKASVDKQVVYGGIYEVAEDYSNNHRIHLIGVRETSWWEESFELVQTEEYEIF